ncbi:unnamed protein product (macronuclear) [Paramecium tetraurelia]|uniref:Uncharacterized protein n=1 Tax=Paramecium tetraurelia TaxID=5888 RepID=A0DT29_PARTE|nr:uncharacterized protein GSPATT00019889001 [Paramecium tetraurelia]CAK86196.1 unnamed protein product [Paramecium tetraurelia]|eukprot:XP_001453593.1 hypothetical protein (macronuclear) [Paramecium tetraurelia strain d4-2]
MIKITSPLLNYRFKMLRVQCKPYDNVELIRDQIMDLMNEYLQESDGQECLFINQENYINVKVISNNQIALYFVTGTEMDDTNWEQQISRGPLQKFTILSNSIEIRPSRF